MNLKKLRTNTGISQKELAAYMDVSVQTLFNWENGLFQPSIDDLIKLADYFGVSLDYLVGRKVEFSEHSYIRAQLEKIPFDKFLDFIEEQLKEMSNDKKSQ